MRKSIRVASVPGYSRYERHIGHPDDGIERIPAKLNRSWLERNAGVFDVLHLQSGHDTPAPGAIDRLCNFVRRSGKPIVYTVHELAPGPARESQTAMIRNADAVIVVTEESETQLFLDEAREAELIPHPHVLPLRVLRNRPRRRQIPPFVIGVPIRTLGNDAVAEAVVEAVAERVRESAWFEARIDILRTAEENEQGVTSQVLAELTCGNNVEVRFHDRFNPETLVECSADTDIAVIPSATGSHTTWLEVFRDSGAAVVMPSVGTPVHLKTSFQFEVFPTGAPRLDDLRDCIESAAHALTEGEVLPADLESRLRQRRLIANQHRRVYLSALSDRTRSSRVSRLGESGGSVPA